MNIKALLLLLPLGYNVFNHVFDVYLVQFFPPLSSSGQCCCIVLSSTAMLNVLQSLACHVGLQALVFMF